MLGAIIGDIAGSVYERDNIKTKDFPLFRDDCYFTDDSVRHNLSRNCPGSYNSVYRKHGF
jgi:hypothetical protein